MDLMLLCLFQRQVALQCEAILFAAEDLQRALRIRASSWAWISIQNLLGAGANASKALWGQGGKFAGEREPLRRSLQVEDTSPLREVAMRNRFEHFDEKMDEWWDQSTDHNYVDMNFGDVETAISGVDEKDMFRNFDPATGDLIFWGERFNLQAIVDEARRVLPIAIREANKPHWEPPQSTVGGGQ